MAKHNALAAFSAELAETAHAAGIAWMIENPADCGDPDGAAWWPRFRDHAPLWQLPRMRAALAATEGATV
eukprot:1295013-Pleurochrysis_carterae.AAC.1